MPFYSSAPPTALTSTWSNCNTGQTVTVSGVADDDSADEHFVLLAIVSAASTASENDRYCAPLSIGGVHGKVQENTATQSLSLVLSEAITETDIFVPNQNEPRKFLQQHDTPLQVIAEPETPTTIISTTSTAPVNTAAINSVPTENASMNNTPTNADPDNADDRDSGDNGKLEPSYPPASANTTQTKTAKSTSVKCCKPHETTPTTRSANSN